MAVGRAKTLLPSCLSCRIDGIYRKGILINTLIGFSSLALTSCISVNQQLLPKVHEQAPPIKKGVLEIQIGEINYITDDDQRYPSTETQANLINPYINDIMLHWKSHKIIANYGKASELKSRPDYILSISGTLNRDYFSVLEDMVFFSSFFVIPRTLKETYDMIATFTNAAQKKSYKIPIKNAFSAWNSITLLPVTPFYNYGYNNMIRDSANYLYSELKRQGAFEPVINDKSDLNSIH